MKTSPNIAQISDALAQAQAEMTHPLKDKVAKIKSANADYSYNYADLASVLDAVRPSLNKHGIAILQAPQVAGEQLTVTTTLVHSSGEWIESELSNYVDPQAKIQTLGSAITYLRRYALQSIAGVTAEDDDDGNAASGTAGASSERRPARARQSDGPRSTGPATTAPAANAAKATPPPAEKPAAESAEERALKVQCDELVVEVAKLIGQPAAVLIYNCDAGKNNRKVRLGLLQSAFSNARDILRVLGDGRGGEVLHDIAAHTTASDLMDALQRAANGVVPSSDAAHV